MRFDKNDIITSQQLFTLLGSSIVGTGILSMARSVSEVAGRDGWISTFIGGIVIVIGTIIIIQLGKRFPNETFVEYIHKITGKFLSYFIVLFYILFALASCSIVIRILAQLLNTWLLRFTPRSVICFLTVALCVYLSRNGIKVLGRFTEFIFLLLVPLSILIIVPLFTATDFMNILPIGQEGFVNILKGALPAIYAYSGFDILLIYFPFVTPREKITVSALTAVSFVVILYTVTVAAQLIIFPQSSIMEMWMPVVNYILNVRLPFIQRIDLIFIYFWIMAIFSTAAIQYYTATVEIKQLFKLKDRKLISSILAPVVFFASIQPNNVVEIGMITDILSKLGVAAGIILPAILLIICVIFSIRSDRNNGYNKN
jgi:spore germination protein